MSDYTFSQLEQLWEQAGGSTALAPLAAGIAEVESSGNPNAYNPSGASGLWQIEIPLNEGDVPGGAANVFNAQDNAKAAVALSGNTLTGLTDNWLDFEPAGAAEAIAAQNGGTVPAASATTGTSSTSTTGTTTTATTTAATTSTPSTSPAAFVGEISTLLHDAAAAINFVFQWFKPGQQWRVAAALTGTATGYMAFRSLENSGNNKEEFPLGLALAGFTFLAFFMAFRPWPQTTGGASIRPTVYAIDIIEGKPPIAGPPPGNDTSEIEVGLAAIIGLWGVGKLAGIAAHIAVVLGDLLKGIQSLMGGGGNEGGSAGEEEPSEGEPAEPAEPELPEIPDIPVP
jgi:Transglycosylase SLT domain